jgi:hypothetical protein
MGCARNKYGKEELNTTFWLENTVESEPSGDLDVLK